jgi:hypothetical protein
LADRELARAPLVEFMRGPGPAGLESVLAEIAKLQRLRAIRLPADLFADVVPKTRQGYRQRMQVEEPYELRWHAAWAALRSGEQTDNLVDTLVQTIERIDTTAQQGVEQELLADFRRVTGKADCCSAERLVLSIRTVERHIKNVYNRLGIQGKAGRASVTAYALRHGVIESVAA